MKILKWSIIAAILVGIIAGSTALYDVLLEQSGGNLVTGIPSHFGEKPSEPTEPSDPSEPSEPTEPVEIGRAHV